MIITIIIILIILILIIIVIRPVSSSVLTKNHISDQNKYNRVVIVYTLYTTDIPRSDGLVASMRASCVSVVPVSTPSYSSLNGVHAASFM